ncbi:MAG: RNA polymerase sigma factor [Bacteroidota bacterium]
MRNYPSENKSQYHEKLEKLYKELFSFALSLAKNRVDAEYLVQDSIIKCHTKKPEIFSKPYKACYLYIRKVVKNLYLDRINNTQAGVLVSLENNSILDSRSIDQNLIKLETIERFVEFGYVKLTNEQKKYFDLMLQPLNDREIAEKLGKSLITVRVMKTKVREKIKKAVRQRAASFEKIYQGVKNEYNKKTA